MPDVYTWRVFVTPFVGAVSDVAGTFEVRGTLPLPMQLTLHGRYDGVHRRAVLTGRLIAPGNYSAGVSLALFTKTDGYSDFEFARFVIANSRGEFTAVRPIKTTTQFGLATATWYDCEPGSTAPAGCVSDTLATIGTSAKVIVRKR